MVRIDKINDARCTGRSTRPGGHTLFLDRPEIDLSVIGQKTDNKTYLAWSPTWKWYFVFLERRKT